MDAMVLAVQKWLNENYNSGVTEDGVTGNGTFRALIKALQKELGIAQDGSLGNGTLSACPDTISAGETNQNLVYILQGSFWCKGYNPGGFDGVFGAGTTNAVKNFQKDAGITEDGIVRPYILQGIMNTDGYAFTATDDVNDTYRHEVQMGLNKYYGSRIGLIAPNGIWERKSHKNLIKACQLEWGASADGVWGPGTMNAAPTLSRNTSGYTNSKRLLQWCLAINGFYPGGFTGTFGDGTYNAVYSFQNLMELGADGIAGKNTWASLLSSCGNTDRATTAFDTATRLTAATARAMKNSGYTEVGRYLTNTPGGTLDKKMTPEEIEVIRDAGLKIFPIFQTYGGEASYFTRSQGSDDAATAVAAAKNLGFPQGTTIYFAVDYDVLVADMDTHIIPYFCGIQDEAGWYYRIGVYGPRMVCNTLQEMGITSRSFVSDMSSGFTGNIGVPMPTNWAYDQYKELTVNGIGIDKCGVSSTRKTAVSPDDFEEYVDPDEPEITQPFTVFRDLYNLAHDYMASYVAQGVLPSVKAINRIVLAYLRKENYHTKTWTLLAGAIDEGFNEFVEKSGQIINPNDISIIDPMDNISMEISHFAATLGAYSFYVSGFNTGQDKELDCYTGWAGDLLQMAAFMQATLDHTGNNYFGKNDLMKMVGATDEEIADYTIYYKDDDGTYKKTTSSGFSRVDLYQDIDAYNIHRLYDLSSTKLYIALNDYYNVSDHWKNRFSIFKSNLISEHNIPTLQGIAYSFTTGSIKSEFFGTMFGQFDNTKYGRVVAEAFSDKFDQLISVKE